MIPYYGHHSSKQYLKGKSVRFEYKVWCLCSLGVCLFQFNVYSKKCLTNATDLGLGGDIVNKLLNIVEDPKKHVIYFDNFFISYSLMNDLTEKHFFATGTIREN